MSAAAMKTFVGIDLGSTTTKSVVLDDSSRVIGRGITNSRSNYGTAARVAGEEARVDARFTQPHLEFGKASALELSQAGALEIAELLAELFEAK